MNHDTEQEIIDKGLTAPRVARVDIEADIASEHYFTAFDGAAGNGQHSKWRDNQWEVSRSVAALHCMTFCVLVLRNGYTVTGESACASPANFNAELGRTIAREKAVEKVWPLLGFRLLDRLAGEEARS